MKNNCNELTKKVGALITAGAISLTLSGCDDREVSTNNSNNTDLNNILSQVSPEMLNNLSSMLNSNNGTSNNQTNNQNSNNFNIDMNTIMKMKSVMEKLNNSDDPRSNLLNSLKPYLRNEKKEKLDQYANLINFAKIAEIMKNDNKE